MKKILFVSFLSFIILSCSSSKQQSPNPDGAMKNDQYVLVFKKEITREAAEAFIASRKIKARFGSDSSRGKVFFYNHGPQFITDVDFKIENELLEGLRAASEISEVYKAQWNIKKD